MHTLHNKIKVNTRTLHFTNTMGPRQILYNSDLANYCQAEKLTFFETSRLRWKLFHMCYINSRTAMTHQARHMPVIFNKKLSRFSKWRLSAILDLVWRHSGPPTTCVWWS